MQIEYGKRQNHVENLDKMATEVSGLMPAATVPKAWTCCQVKTWTEHQVELGWEELRHRWQELEAKGKVKSSKDLIEWNVQDKRKAISELLIKRAREVKKSNAIYKDTFNSMLLSRTKTWTSRTVKTTTTKVSKTTMKSQFKNGMEYGHQASTTEEGASAEEVVEESRDGSDWSSYVSKFSNKQDTSTSHPIASACRRLINAYEICVGRRIGFLCWR